MTSLSPDQIEAYRRDGVLFPFDVLSPGEVERALAVVAAFDRQEPDVRKSLLLHNSHYVSRTLADMCRNPRILDAVEGVIGPNILVWGANFFLKEPRSTAYVSWHQDATYWGLDPADVVTAWVALTPSTRESGCLRVAPGTHRLGIVEHKETWNADNLLSRGQEIAIEVDPASVVDVPLAPGQMSLHHVKIAHNSEPNRADHRRIGFAIRYVGAHVRQISGARDRAMPVRGEDRWRYFEPIQGSNGEMDPSDLARHQASWNSSRLVPAKPANT